MPKCKNCKWCIGFDIISGCFICNVAGEIDYVDYNSAEDDDLGCDLFVDNSNDDTA